MRYNKRDHFSCIVPISRTEDALANEAVMAIRVAVAARIIQAQAKRRGRVVIWPSVVKYELMHPGSASYPVLVVRGQTRARPDWKRAKN